MTQQTIAQLILIQLGNGRFVTMTGAKNLLDTGKGLSFRIPGTMTKNRINHVKVELNGFDLYNVTFGRIHGTSYKIISTHEDVFCENLVELFEDSTGLFTHF